jgi:diacylglycerol kinase family enzyme
LFSGRHVGDPLVDYHQVKEFSIIPQEDNILNIDGEMIGSTPIHVTVEQGLIDVLV